MGGGRRTGSEAPGGGGAGGGRRRRGDRIRRTVSGSVLAAGALAALAAGGGAAADAPPAAAGSPAENFQGQHACPAGSRAVVAGSLEELRALLAAPGKVKAGGSGHNWGADLACAGGEGEESTVVVPALGRAADGAVGESIVVDEERGTVRADGWVLTSDLLDFLARHGRGWTLRGVPYWIHQTIAGAVATGTHGSSRHGSLSGQLLGADVVLANGTLLSVDSESRPDLLDALRVSVGRLGLITSVELPIVPNAPVRRESTTVSAREFLAEVAAEAQLYADGEAEAALEALDERQYIWFVPLGVANRVAFEARPGDRGDATRGVLPEEDPPAPPGGGSTTAAAGPYEFGRHPARDGLVAPALARPAPDIRVELDNAVVGAQAVARNMFASMQLPNATLADREARITSTREMALENALHSDYAVFDQYEFSFPLEKAPACLEALAEAATGERALAQAFTTPALVRFVGQEAGLLSHTHDGPRVFLNIEDYQSYNTFANLQASLQPGFSSRGLTGRTDPQAGNPAFQALVDLLRSDLCGARIHWGKAGFPRWGFSGPEDYPETWCRFGDAVRELDPEGKFAGASEGTWDFSSCS